MHEILKSDDVEERCGLELRNGTLIEIANVAEDPIAGYLMEPEAVMALLQSGEVIGTWHTHPGADPNLSGDDYKGFLMWPDLEHSIIGVRKGVTTVVRYRVEDGLVFTCE